MTNTFIPTLSRYPLYCVWIKTGNPAHPLDRVWIDPKLRSFVNVETASPIRATNDESEPETSADPLLGKGLFAAQSSIAPVRRKQLKVKAYSAMKKLSWVLVILWLLLTTASAAVAGRISGMISDPSGASSAGATVTLNNVANGTKRTTTNTDRGQYSFPVVPVGR
jgi:hypothetical protein